MNTETTGQNAAMMSGNSGMNHSVSQDAMSHGVKKEGSFVDPMSHMNDPVQKLINSTKHTHRTIKSGAWSDPKTWSNGRVPGDKANALISKGTTVLYDQVSDARLKTVSVEGSLKFATAKDTQLKVETILNGASGQLEVGKAGNAVAANRKARIIFTSDTAITANTKWDPKQLSKGLVSEGVVNIHGADKTDHLALQGDAVKGSSVLKFKTAPKGWQVGDRIVLGGTEYNSRGKDSDNSRFQDEVLKITSIKGNEVRFENEDIKGGNRNVLRFNHTRTKLAGATDQLSLYAANLTRNVSFETENGKSVPINRRAHVMLMHNPSVNVLNAGFYDLGRSDKSRLVDDPIKNTDGSKGNGKNPRGRYSLHLHRTGTDAVNGKASIVRGNAVSGSPGWGIVQHDSHAGLEDNVVFDVTGAGISAEAGNETGWWTNNLTIKTTGIGLVDFNKQMFTRERLFDFGVQGTGFWVQGAAQLKNKDNKAISSNGAGMTLFGGSNNQKYLRDATTLNVSDLSPELRKLFPAGQKEVDVRDVPMETVEGLESYNAALGLRIWGHSRNFDGELTFSSPVDTAHEGRSLIKDFKLWGNRFRGASIQYSSNIDLKDGLVLGNEKGKLKAVGAGVLNNQETYGGVFDNLTIAGFEVGADIATPNNDKEFIASTISNSNFSSNTYHLTEAGVPSEQLGLNDFAAFVKLKNNKFTGLAGNKAPVARFNARAVGGLGFELNAGDSSDADPLRGANPKLSQLESKGIAAYGWDLDGNGSIDRYGRNITHVFNRAGNQKVGLTVWDSQGQSTTLNQTLTVKPTAYINAFVNPAFNNSKIQISGNDNSQWADKGWYGSKGVRSANGIGKISVKGDRSNYIGQVVNNEKVHRGQQTLSFDLKNVDAGKSRFDANEVTVTFWGVNGQFDQFSNETTGPFQVGTLPMQRTQLARRTFDRTNNGLFDWKKISTDVNLGNGYDYLVFQVNAEKINDARDFVAIDNLSLTGKANGQGNAPLPPVTPTPPSVPVQPVAPNPVTPNPVPNPTNPKLPTNGPTFPSELAPVARLTFDEGKGSIAVDTSSAGIKNNGRLQNARWVDGKFGKAVALNGKGNSRVNIQSSKDINQGTHKERTVSLWFKADNTSTDKKQVIYEEGGRASGLNIYLEDNLLNFGGWSNKGGWKDGDWVSTTKVKNNKWHHVALVLDGDNKLQPNALTAYLDGNRVGTTDGTQLWSRGDKLGLGNTGGSTRFADGTFGRQQEGLTGGLDQLQIFNDALSASQVRQLSNSPIL